MKLLYSVLVLCVSCSLSSVSFMEAELVPVVVPKQALDIVKQFEGLRLTAYKDPVGLLSIGYGHYNATPPPCTDCMVITEQEANGMLYNDLESIIQHIQGYISVDLTNNQLAAVASFAFNLGSHAFINSTLLKDLNAGNTTAAANQFLLWNKADGRILPGLTARRVAERELFLTPDTEESTIVAGN